MAEAATVEGIMRNRTLVGVENGCRYYVPPGRPPVDRGASYPGCHWYLEANITTAWALQTGLPGAGSEFAWDTTGQEEAFVWGDWFSNESRAAATLAASALDQVPTCTLVHPPCTPTHPAHTHTRPTTRSPDPCVHTTRAQLGVARLCLRHG